MNEYNLTAKELLLKMIDIEINQIEKYKKDLESGALDNEISQFENFDKDLAKLEFNILIYYLVNIKTDIENSELDDDEFYQAVNIKEFKEALEMLKEFEVKSKSSEQ